ncbi:hypothetical protein BC937DRAFT_92473 [Endogone sp. FLAS-F59071]|nr:hypothetical protein BC937DRAFT_92473 [Endogone sp. FLAS-F59071]|eukprot:RUS21504.1 hypothetical protein BC937DRAFT_92473 [Endogone sp. FLAS-F59071]
MCISLWAALTWPLLGLLWRLALVFLLLGFLAQGGCGRTRVIFRARSFADWKDAVPFVYGNTKNHSRIDKPTSPNHLALPSHPQPTPTMSASSTASSSTPTEDTAFNSASWSSKRDSAAETSAEATQRVRELMRVFLKQHTAYDVLPVSYRLIVMDTTLLMKKALAALIQNGVVSAPLWSASTQTFAGMLTVSDFINLIQYYHAHSSVERALDEMEQFQIQHMRDVERRIGQPAPQLLSIHPMASLDEACRLLVESRSHRLPLLDRDEETGQEIIVSVLTQYRILKFIAVNVRILLIMSSRERRCFKETKAMRQPLSELQIGTYGDTVATACMSTPVIQVISMFVNRRISAVPIVDDNGMD